MMENVLNKITTAPQNFDLIIDRPLCQGCGSDALIEDIELGNLYCQDCGLENRTRMIDYHAEWRRFTQGDKDQNDLVRAGRPLNMLLSGGGLSKSHSKANAKLGRSVQSSDLDRGIHKNFKEIAALCDRVGLIAHSLKDKAFEVFRIAFDAGLQKTTRLEYIRIASVLHSARIEGGSSNRTFKEMVLATSVPKKKIAKSMKGLKKALKISLSDLSFKETEHPIISFSKNYGGYLDLPADWIKFISIVANKVRPYEEIDTDSLTGVFSKRWEGRSTSSIAATVVYIVTRLPKCPKKIDVEMVIRRSSVCIDTIKACYRDMLPDVLRLLGDVPPQIATIDEIRETFEYELKTFNFI